MSNQLRRVSGAPINDQARAVLAGELPAGFEGFVGVYPQAIFRPLLLDTAPIEGVSIYAQGRLVPCDGSTYELGGGTLCVGDALVLDVVNQRPEPVMFRATFRGLTIEAAQNEIAHGLKLGAKALRREPQR